MCVRFAVCCKRGYSEGWGGGQLVYKRSYEGDGSLLEVSADNAAFEQLRRAVVVHHAALGLAIAREEEVTESGHL